MGWKVKIGEERVQKASGRNEIVSSLRSDDLYPPTRADASCRLEAVICVGIQPPPEAVGCNDLLDLVDIAHLTLFKCHQIALKVC